MNKGTPKNKKRHSHSPQEANNSFVKNVTSTVSYLLPSSITKWFSSPITSNANGSAQAADATDSSSEDDVPESPILAQPPPKRMRYSSTVNVNNIGQAEVIAAASNVDSIETFNTVQSPPARHTFRREPNYVSTPVNSVSDEPSKDKNEQGTAVFKAQHSVSKIRSSVTRKRKSLFDAPQTDASKHLDEGSSRTVRDSNQPYFKPSLLGSPFYPGRTMYGGAASSYMNQPNIKLCKTAMVNESTSSHDNTISHSARRVMDLLEHYSSPLSEAKRISQYINSTKNESLNRSIDSNSSRANKSISYKTQELHVPSIASILSLKQRSRLMDTTTTARQIIASHSSASNYLPYPKSNTQSESSKRDGSDNLTLKVKNRITRQKRSESIDLNDISTPIKLPTAVLEIDQNNLPKFNFGSPTVSKSSNSVFQTVTAPVTQTSTITLDYKNTGDGICGPKEVSQKEREAQYDNNFYKFSIPVTISKDMSISSPIPKFTFENPKQNIEGTVENEVGKNFSVVQLQGNDKALTEKHKDWKCSDCWVVNKADASNCVCCSAKKSTDNNKCTVKCSICKTELNQVNKCTNCEKTQINTSNNLPIAPISTTSKWRCGDCWVDNDETAEKCVCCGGKNPKVPIPIQNKTSATEIDWKCNDCWINNKCDVDKCIACGGARPGSKFNNKPVITLTPPSKLISHSIKKPENSFQNILKAQTDKWECSNCLVRNDSDKTKCVCCETDKPGVVKEIKETKSFNFGMNTNMTFKFGIVPKAQEDNLNKESEQKSELESKSAEWEANNNVIAKTPTFSFGLPVKKTDEKEEPLNKDPEKVAEVPKLNFTFGIPKQTVTVPLTSGISLETDKNKPESTISCNDKSQEVPTVEFTLPKAQNVPKQVNIFSSSVISPVSLQKPLNAGESELASSAMSEEKNITFKPLILQTTATNEINTSKTFTFTGPGLKPAMHLFSAPVSSVAKPTTSNNSSLLSPPLTTSSSLFQKSVISTTSAIPLFQKVESVPSTLSLFKKTETTTSTETAPSFTTSTKLFNFGNNNQTVLSQSEKSKFNFSFRNTNKTEAPSIFNANFGVTSNSNADTNSNKFTLSTATTVGMSSTLLRSPLGSASGLTTGNPITNNDLPGNNGLSTGNLLGVSELGNNPLNPGNALKSTITLPTTPSSGMFGAGATQKENMWSNTNNSSGNLFVSNATTNNPLQRPATFTFGTSTPFNANNAGSAFGNNTQNVFAMQNQSSNVPSLFSTTTQNQTAPNIFGSPQSTSSPAPAMGVFGNTNVGTTNTFNVLNPSMPTFETPSQTPAPAPSFNFGSPQQLGTGVFGFGQVNNQQQMPQFQNSVYNFGTNQGTPQFNMGSAPNTSGRRVRKAVRRTTQR